MIPQAAQRAFAQMLDPRFAKVLLSALGITLGMLIAAYIGLYYLVGWLVPDELTLPLVGTISWVDTLLSGASVLLMLGLSVFLMVPVA
ncbi:MAG: hypothetical protein AAGD04_17000, partial [Pseudomonadota bacterium]